MGDCVGSSADVFESVAAEIIGAMILGSTLASEAKLPNDIGAKFVSFPLLVHAMDIVVSSIGIAFVGGQAHGDTSNPMTQLQRGYRVALGLSVVGFFFITWWLLEDPEHPGSAFKFFECGLVGMVCAYISEILVSFRCISAFAKALTSRVRSLCSRTLDPILHRLRVPAGSEHCRSEHYGTWNKHHRRDQRGHESHLRSYDRSGMRGSRRLSPGS